MAYEQQWGTPTPGHITYLVDLSGSMSIENDNRLDLVMDCLFSTLDELRCSCKAMRTYNERFTVTVLGYNQKVFTLFKGGVKDLSKLILNYKNPQFGEYQEKRIDKYHHLFSHKIEKIDDNGNLKITYNKDIEPHGCTFTYAAFDAAYEDVQEWINTHDKGSIPAPIVIHVTDGRPENPMLTEEELISRVRESAQKIKNLKVADGNVLLFNVLYNPRATGEIVLPTTPPNDKWANLLYDASSVISGAFVVNANNSGLKAEDGCKALIYNARDKSMVKKFILFGSIPNRYIPETPY